MKGAKYRILLKEINKTVEHKRRLDTMAHHGL
jgi:hypothetical protein